MSEWKTPEQWADDPYREADLIRAAMQAVRERAVEEINQQALVSETEAGVDVADWLRKIAHRIRALNLETGEIEP